MASILLGDFNKNSPAAAPAVGPTMSSVHVPAPMGNGKKKKPVADDIVDKAGYGVMIAWFPPEELAAKIANPSGEATDQLHVTLAYFGKTVTTDQVDSLRKVLSTAMETYSPLPGELGGLARFPATDSSDGKDVVVLLADIPYLESLREHILTTLEDVGVSANRVHGYTPHMTLAYVEPGQPAEVSDLAGTRIPITVDGLTLAVNGERTPYPFVGSETFSKKQTDAPTYRQSDTPGRTCSQCIHGGDGYCDLFKFNYATGFVCDSFHVLDRQFEKYIPPQPVQRNATEGVAAYKQSLLSENRASEEIMTLAQLLANGTPLDLEKVKFIQDYLTTNYEVQEQTKWVAHGPEWQEWMGLGARAGLSWAKRCLRKQLEKGAANMQKNEKVSFTANITKLNEDKHMVFGWASIATEHGKVLTDRQGDTLNDTEMEKMAYDFVLNSRMAGEMHKKVGVGQLCESIVFTKEKQEALGIDLGKTGWWIGMKISDNEVWKAIKSGKYSAFSIHGRGVREQVA